MTTKIEGTEIERVVIYLTSWLPYNMCDIQNVPANLQNDLVMGWNCVILDTIIVPNESRQEEMKHRNIPIKLDLI